MKRLFFTLIISLILHDASVHAQFGAFDSAAIASTSLDKHFLAGGVQTITFTNTIRVVNPAKSLVTKSAGVTLQKAVAHLAGTGVGRFAVFGGGADAINYYGTVTVIDSSLLETDVRNMIFYQDMIQPRGYLAATTVNNRFVMLAGGYNGAVLNTVEIIDFSGVLSNPAFSFTSISASKSTLSVSRHSLTATSVAHLAYFAGGYTTPVGASTGVTSNVVDVYNTLTKSWSTFALSAPRANLASVSLDYLLDSQINMILPSKSESPVIESDIVLFAGGIKSDGTLSSVVDAWFPANDTLYTFPTGLSVARSGLSATSIGGRMGIFVGGNSAAIDYFDADNVFINAFSSGGTLSQSRNTPVSATISGRLVYVEGGPATNSEVRALCGLSPLDCSCLALSTPSCYNPSSATTSWCNTIDYKAGNSSCDDGDWCTGTETCNSIGTCQSTSPPCSVTGCYSCDSAKKICSPLSAGISCEDSIWCNGNDTCDGNGNCEHSGTPCGGLDQCNEVCNEEAMSCLSPRGHKCILESKVGECNGEGICVNKPKSSKLAIALGVSIPLVVLAAGLLVGFFLWRRRRNGPNGAPLKEPESQGSMAMINIMSSRLDNVVIQQVLGSGHYGQVFKGTWNGTTPVALKKLNNKNNDDEDFDREATLLQGLHHPNIVQFLGMYVDDKANRYMVTEFLTLGSLDLFIRKEEKKLNTFHLLAMAKHAAAGMDYLEQKSIVHRDLSLRNLLIAVASNPTDGEPYTVKIADFGLSRLTSEGLYSTQEKNFPVKWTSPEAMSYGTFSSKSDVWSFGIVLWELFSYGMNPYPGMANSEVVEKVSAGFRLPAPEGCPQAIHAIMLDCWLHKPESRPSFRSLYERIDKVLQTVKPKPEPISPTSTTGIKMVMSKDVEEEENVVYNY